jgi:hypothetical protein
MKDLGIQPIAEPAVANHGPEVPKFGFQLAVDAQLAKPQFDRRDSLRKIIVDVGVAQN